MIPFGVCVLVNLDRRVVPERRRDAGGGWRDLRQLTLRVIGVAGGLPLPLVAVHCCLGNPPQATPVSP